MALRTLDTHFSQCLIKVPEDPNGLIYHHRILLLKGSDSQWIWLSPEGEVSAADLTSFQVSALRRDAEFPTRVAGTVFTFDALTESDLDEYFDEAKALAQILGFDASGSAADVEHWFIADPISEQYGEEIPAATVNGGPDYMIKKGYCGLVLVDESWFHCIKVVGDTGFDSYLAAIRVSKARDPRLVGDDRDDDGKRFLTLESCARRMRQDTFAGWPLSGERAAKEAVDALRSAGRSSWDDHHTVWSTRSGISGKSATAREHRFLCGVLRLAMSFDQVDISNLASTELIVRRLRQIEAATKKNPRQPDFEGLDVLLDVTMDETGALLLPKFDKWVGELQGAEARTMKAGRLWREERAAADKRRKDKGNKKEKDEE